MKKIIYLFSVITLFFCSCEKDKEMEQIEDVKELKPKVIEITQDGQKIDVNTLLKDGVIHLLQNKNYHIEVKFEEKVAIVEGEFFKFKRKGEGEFFADFYGRNIKEIKEKVIFKKQGYRNWVLDIEQKPLVPNYILSYEGEKKSTDNNFILDKKSNTILVTSTRLPHLVNFYGEKYFDAQLQLTFPSEVFIENVSEEGEDVIVVEKRENAKYGLTITTAKLRKERDYSIVLPIYESVNGEKGEKIMEITFKGDFSPYINMQSYTWTIFERDENINYIRINDYPYNKIKALINNLRFRIQGVDIEDVIIENINEEYLENLQYSDSEGWSMILKEDKRNFVVDKPIKVFDVYEAENIGGKLVKKIGASKREIYLLSSE